MYPNPELFYPWLLGTPKKISTEINNPSIAAPQSECAHHPLEPQPFPSHSLPAITTNIAHHGKHRKF